MRARTAAGWCTMREADGEDGARGRLYLEGVESFLERFFSDVLSDGSAVAAPIVVRTASGMERTTKSSHSLLRTLPARVLQSSAVHADWVRLDVKRTLYRRWLVVWRHAMADEKHDDYWLLLYDSPQSEHGKQHRPLSVCTLPRKGMSAKQVKRTKLSKDLAALTWIKLHPGDGGQDDLMLGVESTAEYATSYPLGRPHPTRSPALPLV